MNLIATTHKSKALQLSFRRKTKCLGLAPGNLLKVLAKIKKGRKNIKGDGGREMHS